MLKFWELAPSPNNTKVRMALRFKDIPFEAVDIDTTDRSGLIGLCGQELTPVIEDRGIVLNDSEAILQYLDANYRDTPRLFPPDRDGRRAADTWKQRTDSELARNWFSVFFHAIGRRDEFSETGRDRYVEALRTLQDELGDADSFGRPIDDLRVAEWATYALPTAAVTARMAVFRRTQELFGVEPGSMPGLERFLAPWNARLA